MRTLLYVYARSSSSFYHISLTCLSPNTYNLTHRVMSVMSYIDYISKERQCNDLHKYIERVGIDGEVSARLEKNVINIYQQ